MVRRSVPRYFNIDGCTVKVLVAEDDPVSSVSLVSKLEKLGHEVIATSNGRDAWYAYHASIPQIVITDWMMPVVDGPDLCRMIRTDARVQYTYIIMMTSPESNGNYIDGLNSGADDFVTKPFDFEGLKARLRVAERVLNLQSTVDQLEGLLPICSYCKKIRDEQSVWHPVENYVEHRTDTSFEHALCPECAAELSQKESHKPVDRS
jgi:sigma-B regulation protein RsbU (phosphoserine phosphatase)